MPGMAEAARPRDQLDVITKEIEGDRILCRSNIIALFEFYMFNILILFCSRHCLMPVQSNGKVMVIILLIAGRRVWSAGHSFDPFIQVCHSLCCSCQVSR